MTDIYSQTLATEKIRNSIGYKGKVVQHRHDPPLMRNLPPSRVPITGQDHISPNEHSNKKAPTRFRWMSEGLYFQPVQKLVYAS